MKKNLLSSLLFPFAVTCCLSAACAVPAEANVALAVGASSTLQEPGYNHDPWVIQDDDLSTAWMEGADGNGLGEYLSIYTTQYTVITGGVIYPGFYINADLFYKNNAPTRLYFRTDSQEAYLDVTEYATTWQDNFGGYHFVFSEPLVSDGTVRVTIVGVREGWLYDDVCISELHLEGYQGNAWDMPDSSDGQPHASIALPADEFADQSDDGSFSDQSGLSYDGLAYHEQFFTTEPEFLDIDTQKQLASFACALYRMHCHYQAPRTMTLSADQLYSYSRAYMLNWYQSHISDERITSGGSSHYAYKSDLMDILHELFQSPPAGNDLDTFISTFAVSVNGQRICMDGAWDAGSSAGFSLSDPLWTDVVDGRTRLTGNVLKYNAAVGSDEYVMPYYAYFIQDEENPHLFRFDELVVG